MRNYDFFSKNNDEKIIKNMQNIPIQAKAKSDTNYTSHDFA